MCIDIYANECLHIYIDICICIYMYVHICMNICICIHTYSEQCGNRNLCGEVCACLCSYTKFFLDIVMKCNVYDVQQGDGAEYKADDIVGSPDCTDEAFDIPPGAEGVVSTDEAFYIPPGADAAQHKADATDGAPAPPLQPIEVAPPDAGAGTMHKP